MFRPRRGLAHRPEAPVACRVEGSTRDQVEHVASTRWGAVILERLAVAVAESPPEDCFRVGVCQGLLPAARMRAQLSHPAVAGASISAWTIPYAVPIRWQGPSRRSRS